VDRELKTLNSENKKVLKNITEDLGLGFFRTNEAEEKQSMRCCSLDYNIETRG
jgi:hypothetical protein